jgi:hypothetical protein
MLNKNGDLSCDEHFRLMNGLKQNFNDAKAPCLDEATEIVIAEHQSGEIESLGSVNSGDLKGIEKSSDMSDVRIWYSLLGIRPG